VSGLLAIPFRPASFCPKLVKFLGFNDLACIVSYFYNLSYGSALFRGDNRELSACYYSGVGLEELSKMSLSPSVSYLIE
jgi:hypothetical protein